MENKTLWAQFESWKKDCEWVDLSREFSPQTLHWAGFPDLDVKVHFDYPDGSLVHMYTMVSQYGTHVDAPCHFVQGKRTLDQIEAEEMVLPLCVIDVSEEVKGNVDFTMDVAHIEAWEQKYGKIPVGSFVALRTDWSKRSELDNEDENGVKHFPGWGLDALKLLATQRHVTAIGHEAADTDSGINTGYIGEYYILEQDCYQIELMCNLDQVPPVGALIFCGFPKAKGSPGFTARCLALCPKVTPAPSIG